MEILDGDTLYELIFRRYSRNPRGWSFRVSPAPEHGFYDAFVGNREEAWQLKLDTIFKPSPFVLGSSIGAPRRGRGPSFPMQFGFRELNSRLKADLEAEDEGGSSRKLGAFLASIEPVVPKQGRTYAEGPYVLTPPLKPDPRLSTLDERLSAEMRKLLLKRYPGYG